MFIPSISDYPLTNHVRLNEITARICERFHLEVCRQQPQALICSSRELSVLDSYLSILPFVYNLPRLQLKEIAPVKPPRLPEEKDFLYDDSKELDHRAYWFALDKYKADLNAYCEEVKSKDYKRGILLTNHKFPAVIFNEKVVSCSS